MPKRELGAHRHKILIYAEQEEGTSMKRKLLRTRIFAVVLFAFALLVTTTARAAEDNQ
jgi:hypothetical protein